MRLLEMKESLKQRKSKLMSIFQSLQWLQIWIWKPFFRNWVQFELFFSCYCFNLTQYTMFVCLKGVTDSFDPDKANFSSMFTKETIEKQFVLIFSSLLLSFQFSSNLISFTISLFQGSFLVHFNSESIHWSERGRYKGSGCNVGNDGKWRRDYATT
jgi:hypothetical protein